MADFEDTLNRLLSDPNVMGQIMSLANSLGTAPADAPPPSAPVQNTGETESTQSETSETQATNPSSTASLGDILAGLSGGLTPNMLQSLSQILQEYRQDKTPEQSTALLLALRPFLKETRQANIEKAVQWAKVSRLVRIALRNLKGGDGLV